MSKKQSEDSVKVRLERVQEAVQESLKKAEQNLQRSLKEIGEKFAEAQAEAKKRLDEVVEAVEESDFASQAQDALQRAKTLRDDLAEKIGPEALWGALGLATKSDLQDLSRKLNALSKKVKELEGGKRPAPRARAEA
jgi:replicative DNA helicase